MNACIYLSVCHFVNKVFGINTFFLQSHHVGSLKVGGLLNELTVCNKFEQSQPKSSSIVFFRIKLCFLKTLFWIKSEELRN